MKLGEKRGFFIRMNFFNRGSGTYKYRTIQSMFGVEPVLDIFKTLISKW